MGIEAWPVMIDEHARLKALAKFPERNPNPVIEVTATGNIRYANPAASSCLEKMGLPPARPEQLLPSDYRQRLQKLGKGGKAMDTWEYEVGSQILSCNVFAMEDLACFHLYIVDITEQRRAEANQIACSFELRDTQDKLLKKEQLAAIGEFAAGIVHEIRSPLSTLEMALDYFNQSDLPEPAKRRAKIAAAESSRLQRLLTEILLYAKPTSLDLKSRDINHLVSDTLATFKETGLSGNRQIVTSGIPTKARILGDLDKLKQVFINLLSNACDAIADGESVYWDIAEDETGQCMAFVFRNGGTPISEKLLDKITEPFLTTKPHGTGLGMAIVARIVEAHEGKLEITSSEKMGTKVVITIGVPDI